MKNNQVKQWKERILKIKKELSELGDMRPGSISEQFNVCGNPNCHCKDKDSPIKHGPYYQLSYSFKGRSTTEFIKPEKLAETTAQISEFKNFKSLSAELTELSIMVAKEIKKMEAEKLKELKNTKRT